MTDPFCITLRCLTTRKPGIVREDNSPQDLEERIYHLYLERKGDNNKNKMPYDKPPWGEIPGKDVRRSKTLRFYMKEMAVHN